MKKCKQEFSFSDSQNISNISFSILSKDILSYAHLEILFIITERGCRVIKWF
jgi:hypothetical protein